MEDPCQSNCHRLVQGRRFDLAREVCDVIIAREPVNHAVRDHFAGYRRRLDLVGRPAPAIRGTDIDGADVRLDDLKDKVVLVIFWATWCNPCVEKIPILTRALELYEKDGFAILGVNLDSGPDRERLVRCFVVEFGIPWPNVLSGEGEHDIAGSYAVSEIPANLLIGRDGKVVTFDLGVRNCCKRSRRRCGPRGDQIEAPARESARCVLHFLHQSRNDR